MDKLDPKPGETFLELAAGPGDTGFEIANRVAPDGRLISTDLAPAMVEAATRRAADKGVTNVDFRAMDAQHLDLPDASIDGVVHRFGPMLLPDPLASAREVHRCLRDGGRYAASSWASIDKNPVFPLMGRALVEHGFLPPPPAPDDGTGPGGMASMADHGKVRATLQDASFSDITIEDVPAAMDYHTFDELWVLPSELAGPIAQLLRTLSASDLERAKDAIRSAAEPYLEDEVYRFPSLAVCFIAR
jgi:SAM-dependent methyltransferase